MSIYFYLFLAFSFYFSIFLSISLYFSICGQGKIQRASPSGDTPLFEVSKSCRSSVSSTLRPWDLDPRLKWCHGCAKHADELVVTPPMTVDRWLLYIWCECHCHLLWHTPVRGMAWHSLQLLQKLLRSLSSWCTGHVRNIIKIRFIELFIESCKGCFSLDCFLVVL